MAKEFNYGYEPNIMRIATSDESAIVDYTVRVLDKRYILSCYEKIPLEDEVRINWILTMDGVFISEEMKEYHLLGPVFCRIYARCLMRTAAQVRRIHPTVCHADSALTPLALDAGTIGENPEPIQIVNAAAVSRALNWCVFRDTSIADKDLEHAARRTNLVYKILQSLHESMANEAERHGNLDNEVENTTSSFFVVNPNLSDVGPEYELDDYFALNDEIFENAYELLSHQNAMVYVRPVNEETHKIVKALGRIFAGCIFRSAARIIRVRKYNDEEKIVRQPLSVLVGDTGEVPLPVQVSKARAVFNSVQWGPRSWKAIVGNNKSLESELTRLVHMLVRAIHLYRKSAAH